MADNENKVAVKTTENIKIEELLNSNLVKNLAQNLQLSRVQIAKANSAVLQMMTDEKLQGTTQISKVRFAYAVAGQNYKNPNAIAPIKYDNAIQAQPQYQAFIEDMLECGGLKNNVFYTYLYKGQTYKAHINKSGFAELEIPETIELKDPFEKLEIIGYYCRADLKDGTTITSVMSVEQFKEHANTYSKAYKSGKFSPYTTNFDLMGLKTVIKAVGREVLKHYPTDRLAKTIQLDMAVFDEQGVSYKDNPQNEVEEIKLPEKNGGKKTKIDNKIEMPQEDKVIEAQFVEVKDKE